MATHIALIGRTKEPILKGFQHYGSITRLYLLHSPNNGEFEFRSAAEDVRQRLHGIGFDNVELREIDAFDMHNIINEIISIVEKEDPPIYINITGGTNLMAGAACSAAFFVGAKAYYVLGKKGASLAESEVIELPVPNIPYHRVLKKTQLTILQALGKLGGSTSNSALRMKVDLSPQELSYHIRELERKALVVANRGERATTVRAGKIIAKTDRRKMAIALTNAGKLVLNWSRP